jgi:hypothetical protein
MIELEYSSEKDYENKPTYNKPFQQDKTSFWQEPYRKKPFEPVNKFPNKENVNISNKIVEGSLQNSHSYIMAMRTLQTKLEEKDRIIKELESKLKEVQKGEEFNSKSRQTASFSFNPEKKPEYKFEEQDNRGRVEKVFLERQGKSIVSISSNDLDNSFSKGNKKECHCKELESVTARAEELQRELELARKKLQNQKEHCGQLQDHLDIANKQMASFEALVSKKDKEIKTMENAVKNMKDLVDIIGKKKKGGNQPNGLSLMDSNYASESMISLKKYSEEDHCSIKDYAQGACQKEVKEEEEIGIPSVINDIVTHILLNEELAFEHLDLFSFMKDKMTEFKGQLRILEHNYEFLTQSRKLLVEDAKVGPGVTIGKVEERC